MQYNIGVERLTEKDSSTALASSRHELPIKSKSESSA